MAVQSLGAIIKNNAERLKSAVAVSYPDATLTWAELDSRSNRRARLLHQLGVKHNDLVAIMLPNGSEFHEVVVAVWKVGATPCILPSKLPGREAADVLALARPAAVFGVLSFKQEAPLIGPGADLSTFDDAALEPVSAAHWKAVASGGSSGRPKIILDMMPAAVDTDAAPYAAMGMSPGGVLLNPGPLYHNMPFLFTSNALLAGMKVVGMARFDAEECLRLVDLHKVEFVAFVPTMMQRIWALPQEVRDRYDVSSLKVVWHMAAPCPQWLKHFWIDWIGAEKIIEAYGGTEGGGTVISGVEWLTKPGSVGKVMPGTLRILLENGEEAAPGIIGEVHFPAALIDKFKYIGAETNINTEGGYSIGDLGYIDDDGYLFLSDRRSDLILRGGANVYPAEVEMVLDEHPLVTSSAVIGLPDSDLGERVHAILQIKQDSLTDFGSISDFIAERLAKYKWPTSYELSEISLRDDAGKVRRTGLKLERLAWIAEGKDFFITAESWM